MTQTNAILAPPVHERVQDSPRGLHPTLRCEGKGPRLMLREPHGFEWNHVRLPVPGLPADLDGLRILHVSDFHLRKHWSAPLDRLLSRIQADPPDLLLAT